MDAPATHSNQNGYVYPSAIERAQEYLGAQSIGGGLYAYRIGTGRWYVTTLGDMLAVEQFANDFRMDTGEAPDKQSVLHEHAAKFSVAMPAWWSPEQRFIVRTDSGTHRYATADEAREAWKNESCWKLIGADLSTGQEKQLHRRIFSDGPSVRTFERVRALISDHWGFDEYSITPDTEILRDLGPDSLGVIEAVVICETEFDLDINEEDPAFRSIVTVGDAARYIESLLAAQP